MRPRVLLVSSSESAPIARALQSHMEQVVDAEIWADNFELSKTNIENLADFLLDFDFAVVVLSDHDSVKIRDKKQVTTRDNVIFEAGLFIGQLGRQRVVFVSPRDVADFRFPSDLAGISFALYSSEKARSNLLAAMSSAAMRILEHIKTVSHDAVDSRNSFEKGILVVPVKLVARSARFLLVKSTQGRNIFPKARIRQGEVPETIAAHTARLEAGVTGILLQLDLPAFSYFKEESGVTQMIQPYAMVVQKEATPKQKYRSPEWFKGDDAIEKIEERRDFTTSRAIENIIQLIRSTSATKMK